MKKQMLFVLVLLLPVFVVAQTFSKAPPPPPPVFKEVKKVEATPVKNQAMTGTCWCFSTTSLVESDEMRVNKKEVDLSEMFTVRNIYVEKAKNYILRQGHAQFGEGGLSHDMIRAVATYGAVPESAYTGLKADEKSYNHMKLVSDLQHYLDSVLKKQPITNDWLEGYVKILDDKLGAVPKEFTYEGKTYTPLSFAKDVLHFNAADYVPLTSFLHQPYYKPFILQVPDNFANGSFYNLPLSEMTKVVKDAVSKGYTVAWDADVSNMGFNQQAGLAMNVDNSERLPKEAFRTYMKEETADSLIRQKLYENLTTQDDHLMHITGVETSPEGKLFFIVKNSWGKVGPFDGYIHVSEAYFQINTISVMLPKAALSKEMMAKLGLK